MAPKNRSASWRRMSQFKDFVLGKRYELSLVFVPASRMRELNRIYRGKDVSTDILSFPLSETSGEIILSKTDIRRKARECDRTYDNYLEFVVIHGLCHLKGMTHGSTMDKAEKVIRAKFGV